MNRIKARRNPDRNDVQVYEGGRLALTLTFPQIRHLVAQLADIVAEEQRQRATFAEIVRGPKGPQR